MLAIQFVLLFLQVYSMLLFVRVALTWFPNINWYNQPFNALAQLTDPYLDLFRSIVPSFGGIDLSPMLGVIVLQLVGQVLVQGLNMVF